MRSILITAVALLASPALAHDFWIAPAMYLPEAGRPLAIALHIGHAGHFDPYAYNPTHAVRFEVIDPSGETARPMSSPGRSPAGVWIPNTPGAHVIVYSSAPQDIEMEPAKFESYLREEGLESVVEARQDLGESGVPGRESYARAAKSIVLVGGDGAETSGWDREVGLELELIPQTDPLSDRHDRDFAVVLLWKGRPLADARVDAARFDARAHDHEHAHEGDRKPGDDRDADHVRTDKDGIARFADLDAGVWLFTCTHMVRDEDDTTENIEWRSIWASLSCPVIGHEHADRPSGMTTGG